EGTVALAQECDRGAVRVASEEIGNSVAVEVADGEHASGWFASDGRLECAITVAEHHLGPCNAHQIELAVAVQVHEEELRVGVPVLEPATGDGSEAPGGVA